MNRRGFTLIEVLIAISIAAVMMTILYGTFKATIDSAEALDRQADSFRTARIFFYRLTTDLTMFYQVKLNSPPDPLNDPPFGARPMEGKSGLRSVETGTYPDDILSFTTLSPQLSWQTMPTFGASEISYSLSEEGLFRDASFRNNKMRNSVGESVLGINFRYFHHEAEEWLDVWPPVSSVQGSSTTPHAIEVELILKDPSYSATSFVTNLPLNRIFSPIETVFERKFKTVIEINSSKTLY
jgi:prepilin-type N-terminal cleavage/methylation domain-containing protein